MSSALDITFHGTVQGVGFRYTAHELARTYPELEGWVRNEFNGSVGMHLQGPEQIINNYLNTLVHESRLARLIDRTVRTPGTPDPGIRGFRIERSH